MIRSKRPVASVTSGCARRAGAAISARPARCSVESLEIGRTLRDRRAAWSLDVLACLCLLEGKIERALQLAGAGTAMHEAAGNRPPPTWDQFVATVLQAAWSGLDAGTARAAWDSSRRLEPDRALDLALESPLRPALAQT